MTHNRFAQSAAAFAIWAVIALTPMVADNPVPAAFNRRLQQLSRSTSWRSR